MLPRLVLWSCLLAGAVGVGYTAPPPYLTQLVVTGTWTPAPQVGAVGWQADQGRLRLPAGQGETARITRAEALPEQGWTIDMWMAHLGGGTGERVDLFIGPADGEHFRVSVQPEGGRATVDLGLAEGIYERLGHMDYLQAGAGPVQWLRLAYSPKDGAVQAWINGASVTWGKGAVEIPDGPVAIEAKPSPQGALEIAAFQVGPYAPAPAPAPGAAYQGWGHPLKAPTPEFAKQILPRLEALYTDPNLSPGGRGYALAAALLLDQASGKDSSARREGVAEVAAALGGDGDAGVAVFPLLVAAAGPNSPALPGLQATQKALFSALAARVREGRYRHEVLEQAALLDPALTAALAAQAPSLPLARALAPDLAETEPGLALSLYVGLGAENGTGMLPALAWNLPDLQRLAPNYGALMVDYLRALAATPAPPYPRDEPDRSLSFAAYRLTPDSPEQALELVQLIKSPAVAAEAYQCLADLHAGREGGQLDATIEALLKQAVTQFQPSQRQPAPTAELLRLARWYMGRGRRPEAVATVKQAAERATAAGVIATDAHNLYRIMHELQMPEAGAWWDQAVKTAAAADAAYDGPEEGGGEVYLAGTPVLVDELVKQGKTDEALALAQTIKEHLPVNYGLCLVSIIYAVEKQDVQRAAGLLAQVPPGRARSQAIASLLLPLARKDEPAALALMAELPERVQPGWRFILSTAQGQAPTPDLLAAFGGEVRRDLQSLQGREDQWAARGWTLRQVEQMPLGTMLALEPYYAADRAFFARQLLVRVIAATGLDNSPLWKRWLAPEERQSYQLPWGVQHLRDAIWAKQH